MFFHRKENLSQPEENAENPQNISGGNNTSPNIPNPINIVVNNIPETKAVPKKKSQVEITLKIISTALVLALLGTSIYAIYEVINEQAYAEEKDDSYILLNSKNFADSQAVYSKFGTADTTISNKLKIKDYALLGARLYLSESKITPSSLASSDLTSVVGTGYSDIALFSLSTESSSPSTLSTSFKNGKYYIDLSDCSEGDYLIFPITEYYDSTNNSLDMAKIYPFSINSSDAINTTFYSLPSEDGTRKRISLKNNTASPYTVISVVNCGSTLPTNYYDAVIYDAQYQESSDSLTYQSSSSAERLSVLSTIASNLEVSRYKIKAVSSLVEAIEANSNISLALSNSISESRCSIYNSYGFSTLKTKTLSSNSQLGGYDFNPEIRETAGYLGLAGQAYAGIIGNDLVPSVSSKLGKESFIINNSDSSYLETIASVLANC